MKKFIIVLIAAIYMGILGYLISPILHINKFALILWAGLAIGIGCLIGFLPIKKN